MKATVARTSWAVPRSCGERVGELLRGQVGWRRDVAGMLQSAARVGVGFSEAVIAVQIAVMSALGQHLGCGQQGHRVAGIVLEDVAGHLQGFAWIVGLLVESHGLLEEK